MVVARAVTVGVHRAREVVLSSIRRVGKERSGVINAFGRTLAETVTAESDVPPHDTAAIDGFAARAGDTASATEKNPRSLSLLAEHGTRGRKLDPGTVLPVRAGDAIPEGADTVIDAAKTFRPLNDPQLLVLAESRPRENIHPAGEIVHKGAPVLQAGAVITASEMGMLASLGISGITLSQKPRIGIVTTGASVVDIVEPLDGAKTRNAARYALAGMVMEAGCEPGRLVHVREGRVGLEHAIAQCSAFDAVIVALGPDNKHDAAVTALGNVGEVYFERLQAEPCKASAYGTVGGAPVFIIPHDSVLEAFEVLVRPGLMAMLGRTAIERPVLVAALQSTLRVSRGYRHYVGAITSIEGGEPVVTPISPRTLAGQPFAQPNSLAVVPENEETVKRGDRVEVMILVG